MDAVNRKDAQDQKIRNLNREIKSVGLVDTLEGIAMEKQIDVVRNRVRRNCQNAQEYMNHGTSESGLNRRRQRMHLEF